MMWPAGAYKPLPGGEAFLVMKNFEGQTVWKNSACHLYHLGDEVLGLEWNTKMGTIGGEVLEGIQRGIGIAEEKYKGLVIAGDGANFSAGANVGLIFMLAIEQDYDELDMAVRQFQGTTMRARYSAVPVVVAPHGLTLGGACELSLHADRVVACGGIVYRAGGAGRRADPGRRRNEGVHVSGRPTRCIENEPDTITLKDSVSSRSRRRRYPRRPTRPLTWASCKRDMISSASTRAAGSPRPKQSVLELYNDGYTMPVPRKDVKVLGRSALGALYAGIHAMWRGHYATDHDVVVAKKLAYVMCGGDLSEPALVTEQYLLDLEREAFLSLCGEKKTLERIQSVLKGGKPIRN